MTQDYRDSAFRSLKREPENLICFQCGNKNPKWASVTMGLLICYNCTTLHRSLGTHISFVRSVELDKWTRRQLAFMELGGNHRAKDFFRRHGLGVSMDYASEAASRYRLELEERVSLNFPRQQKTSKAEPLIQPEPKPQPLPEPKPLPKVQSDPKPQANPTALPPNKNTVIHVAPVLPVSTPTYKFKKTKAAEPTQFKPVIFRPEEDEFQDCVPPPAPSTSQQVFTPPQAPVQSPSFPHPTTTHSAPRPAEKKAYSSEDFQQQLDAYSTKERMTRFTGASSISSAEYFGRDEQQESSLSGEASRFAEAAAEKASELKDKAVGFYNSLAQRFSGS